MRNIILGTDWGEDCDDAVAVRVLTRSHKAGKINFIGVGINTHTPYAAPSLYRFLEKENCIIPIGVDKSCPKRIGRTDINRGSLPKRTKRTPILRKR